MMSGKRIPLFDTGRRGKLLQESLVHQEILLALDESEDPVAPYELSRRLILRGKAYSQQKTARQIRTHVKDILDNLQNLWIVQKVGEIPSRKFGMIMQPTYVLSPLGKMITSVLLLDADKKETRERQERDVRRYLLSGMKGNHLHDFQFNVLLELLNEGWLKCVIGYFQIRALIICDNHPTLLRTLEPSWASDLTLEERRAYARVFVRVLASLPTDQRKYVETTVKTGREMGYLAHEKGNEYVRAIARRGPLVHIPLFCPQCGTKSVIAKTVKKMLEDDGEGVEDKCPFCGSIGIEPKLHDDRLKHETSDMK